MTARRLEHGGRFVQARRQPIFQDRRAMARGRAGLYGAGAGRAVASGDGERAYILAQIAFRWAVEGERIGTKISARSATTTNPGPLTQERDNMTTNTIPTGYIECRVCGCYFHQRLTIVTNGKDCSHCSREFSLDDDATVYTSYDLLSANEWDWTLRAVLDSLSVGKSATYGGGAMAEVEVIRVR